MQNAESEKRNQESMQKLDAALGISEKFGVKPELRVLRGKPNIVYKFDEGHDLTRKLGSAIDNTLSATTAKTGLNSDSLQYTGSVDSDNYLIFPISEINKRNMDGQFFSKLEKAKPELHAAVGKVVAETKISEQEKKEKIEGYAKRLSEILGVEVKISTVMHMGSGPTLEFDAGSVEKAEKLSDKLAEIRNSAGVEREQFTVQRGFPQNKITFEIEQIEKFPGGPEKLFEKLENKKTEFQAATREALGKSGDKKFSHLDGKVKDALQGTGNQPLGHEEINEVAALSAAPKSAPILAGQSGEKTV
jgi:hypothetical protein